jgi:hypothetical protein
VGGTWFLLLYIQMIIVCLSSVFGPWFLLLYLQTLRVCPSSVYAPDLSFCIFKFFLPLHLRRKAPDYHCVSSNSYFLVFFGVRSLSTLFVSSISYCLSFFGVRTLITPCVSSNSYCLSFFGGRNLISPVVYSNSYWHKGIPNCCLVSSACIAEST